MGALSSEATKKALYGPSSTKYTIHNKTSNLSFLVVFKYLKEKGVINNKFFLRLYDKDLENIDPFSPKLTSATKIKIITEIRKNPYYFLREIVRIKTPIGNVQFEMHPGNLAITWAIFNRLDFIALLPRQKYKTVSIAAALTWIYDFGTKNTQMLFGNKSLGDAKNNLKRFKDIRDNYPDYLKEEVFKSGLDTDNLESIRSHVNNNEIKTAGQPISVTEADKQGWHKWPCINTINCWNV